MRAGWSHGLQSLDSDVSRDTTARSSVQLDARMPAGFPLLSAPAVIDHAREKREQVRMMRSRIGLWGPVNAPATPISDRCTNGFRITGQFAAARHHPNAAACIIRDTDERERAISTHLRR